MLSLDYASFIVTCIYEHAILCLFFFSSLLFRSFLYLFLFRTESRRFYLCKNKTFAWRCSVPFNSFLCSIVVVAFFGRGSPGTFCVWPVLHSASILAAKVVVVDSLSSWSVVAAVAVFGKDCPHVKWKCHEGIVPFSASFHAQVEVLRLFVFTILIFTYYFLFNSDLAHALWGFRQSYSLLFIRRTWMCANAKCSATKHYANASMIETQMNACQLHPLFRNAILMPNFRFIFTN